MSSPLLHSAAAFALAFIATLVLAAWFTPRAWWRRANARALAFLCAGTYGIGTLLWFVFEPVPVAHAAMIATVAPEPLAAAGDYRAYDDLNLRDGTGVSAKRVAVVPAGANVTATGERKGDWWQVSARVDGREVRGWVSSLWLRRQEEAR